MLTVAQLPDRSTEADREEAHVAGTTRGFAEHVTAALRHVDDPVWLGNESPLASAYFLGARLPQDAAAREPEARGRALISLLHAAVDSFWPGMVPAERSAVRAAVRDEQATRGPVGPRYHYLLLDLHYLRRHYPPRTPPNTRSALPDFVGASETRYYAHLKAARERLARALLDTVRPSLRSERPQPAPQLIGREGLVNAVTADLHAAGSVALTGTAGIGKTALGAAVFHAWPGPRFWLTFHPGLNDDLTSVLTALGHFLQQHDRRNLWLYLLTRAGAPLQAEHCLGLLRADLAAAAETPLLLCFDEVDLLRTEASDPYGSAHRPVLELLEQLQTDVSQLWIGQTVPLLAGARYPLAPLSPDASLRLVAGGGPQPLSAAQLHRLTEGNPRLLLMYAALAADDPGAVSDSAAQDAAAALYATPAYQPLFSRLWRRLTPAEKQALGALAVFRSPAPPAAARSADGLAGLTRRRLLVADGADAVALWPSLRALVLSTLPGETRQRLHAAAAAIRAGLGQQTAAAYHLLAADRVAAAVHLWAVHQDAELLQGQGHAARALFASLDARTLPATAGRTLKVIQNRLALLAGDADAVLAGMADFAWHVDDELAVTGLEQWAEAHFIQEAREPAQAKLGEAIERLEAIAARIMALHRRRGQMAVEDGAPATVRATLQEARYELARFEGQVAYADGRLPTAIDHFDAALALARRLDDPLRRTKAHHLLAMAYGNSRQLVAAREHAAAAMAYYEQIGDRVQQEGLRAELAGWYLNLEAYDAVIEPAEAALAFFTQIEHGLWQGYLHSNLAEAYFGLGDLATAERHAYAALSAENPRTPPYAYFTLGLIARARGRTDAAAEAFRLGIRLAQQTGDRFIEAYLQRELGAHLLETDARGAARAALDRARSLFMAAGLSEAAEALAAEIAATGAD